MREREREIDFSLPAIFYCARLKKTELTKDWLQKFKIQIV